MSKYFPTPIVAKPAPTTEERLIDAIRDLEKRVTALEATPEELAVRFAERQAARMKRDSF